ncbi:MAG TPA: bifunctional demethylmenaquinone methyltransferase/2-methoxy-6-polyprenyl-1,4-benzoquinol methylase UbiE [Rariglobus sp.]|nr:bifunctional demethylmenaquinone methyltransferase/2-methoxy-6-polyprenyl-1,4-benzoquinol methylase UbiE [Rariglobus sp.]
MPDPIAVNSMFARIARRYDVANRLLSGGVDTCWRRRLVKAVSRHEPNDILDLATGSGDVAFALSRGLAKSVQITGMDFCQPMLDEAVVKQRASGHYPNITFRQGDGMALPLADTTFDAVTISFGLRNMADRIQALREMHRVLRPGGRLYVLEFSQPQRWFKPIYYFYLRRILPVFAGLVTGDRAAYDYLNASIERYPDFQAMSDEVTQAGFTWVKVTRMTFGIVALHSAVKPA